MCVCFCSQVVSKEAIRIGSNNGYVRCNGMNGGDLSFCGKLDQRKLSAFFLIRPDASMIRGEANIFITFLHSIESLIHSAKLSFCLRKIRIRLFLSGMDHTEAIIRQQPVISGFILMNFEYM